MRYASRNVNPAVAAMSDEEIIDMLAVPAKNGDVFAAAAAELVRRLDTLPRPDRVALHGKRVGRRVPMPAVRVPNLIPA